MLKRLKNKKRLIIILFSALIFVFGIYITLFAFAGSAAAASGVNDVDIPPNISQSAPPNVLIFLDTSGSMMWNKQVNWSNPTTGASGTDAPETWLDTFPLVQAPGSNSVFSKIYNAKMALQDIVTNSSFSNLNYAFATFQPLLLSADADNCIYAKTADGGLDFTNPADNPLYPYYPGNPGGSGTPTQSGTSLANPKYPFKSLVCTGNTNLTKAYFVSYDYSPDIINQDSQAATSPWELWVPQITGANTVPAGDPFFEPQSTAGAAIENILWNATDYKNGGFGDITDPAGTDVIGLKAGGGTPMWSMVTNITTYYTNYISSLSATSTGATCARNYSIIITDGEANGFSSKDTPTAVYDLYNPATTSAPNPIETFIIGFGYTAGIGGKSYLQGMADGGAGIDPSNTPVGLSISGAIADSSPATLTLPGSAFLPSTITGNTSLSGVLVGDTISDNGWESDVCEANNGGSGVYANGNDCATITADSPTSDTVTLSNTLKDFANTGSTGTVTVSGTVYLPNNLTQLINSLTTIFNQIEAQTASFTSPVVNQTSSTSGFVYYANFRTFNQPLWGEGNIFLFHLSPNPTPPPQLVLTGPSGPAVTAGLIDTGDSFWGPGGIGAGGLLQAEAPASRNILTSNYNPSTGAAVPDTATGGTSEIPFNTANDSTLAPLLGITSANYPTICPSATSAVGCADDVINFVLNPNPSDNWKLGAIYHSDPVLVVPPPFAYPSVSYQQFKINNAGRQNVLVAGANDGMVHGFNAADSWDTATTPPSYTCLTGTCGSEMFGYIPPDLLPELTSWFNPAFNPASATTPDKEYEFVDSTPALSDVYFNNIFSVSGVPTANTVNAGSSANAPACVGTTGAGCWHTIAISGERNGGQSYFALGLTDPANIGGTYPDPLWDFSDAANSPTPAATAPMGNTWSQPVISYVCMLNPFYSPSDTGGTGICGNNPAPATSSDTPQFVKTYVGVVGGGYLPDNPAGTVVAGQAVYALYAEPNPVNTGTSAAPVYVDEQELWKFDSSNTGGADMNYQIPSQIAPVTSPNFRLEAFYVGDLGGQMWAFDTPGGQDITAPVPKTDSDILSNWTGCPLFQSTTTSTASPLNIFFPPAISYDNSYNLWLFFGTGNMEALQSSNSRDNELVAINTAGTTGVTTGECPATPYSETNLGNVTTGSTATATTDGWYINLQPNERLVAPPIVYDGIAYFVTYTPSSSGECGYGTASLYAVNYLTGAGEVSTNTGANTGTVSSIGTPGSTLQSGEIGTGVPSAPVVSSVVSGGKTTLTITTQSGQVIQLQIPAQPSAVIPTSWFENQ